MTCASLGHRSCLSVCELPLIPVGSAVSTTVIIPTYDERETISDLVTRLLSLDDVLQILIVDDNSPDGTGQLVNELAKRTSRLRLLGRPGREGLGPAYRHGYSVSMSDGASILGQMDADLSHDPEQLPALLNALRDGADVAIGSRYVNGGGVEGWSLHRQILSRLANVFVRAATGCPVRDSTAGFRAYRVSALRALEVADTTSDGYAFQIEMTLRAWSRGLKICEIPITFVEREHGRSKLSSGIAREALVSVLRWGWRLRRGLTL
jgi:glycosyltransferase involved in cell wall biosynthesis